MGLLSITIIFRAGCFSFFYDKRAVKHHVFNLKYLSLNTMKDMVQYLKDYKIYFL